MSDPQEKDFLVYRGNTIPRVIRLAWTVFLVFAVIYIATNAWGDLSLWLAKK